MVSARDGGDDAKRVCAFWRMDDGTSGVEYALILSAAIGFVSVSMVGLQQAVGGSMQAHAGHLGGSTQVASSAGTGGGGLAIGSPLMTGGGNSDADGTSGDGSSGSSGPADNTAADSDSGETGETASGEDASIGAETGGISGDDASSPESADENQDAGGGQHVARLTGARGAPGSTGTPPPSRDRASDNPAPSQNSGPKSGQNNRQNPDDNNGAQVASADQGPPSENASEGGTCAASPGTGPGDAQAKGLEIAKEASSNGKAYGLHKDRGAAGSQVC